MIIKQEISLADFEAWSGGRDTLDTLIEKDLCEQLEAILDDEGISGADGWDETSLNDLLWLSREEIANWLGFPDWETLENGEDEDEEEDEEADAEILIDCLANNEDFFSFCDKSDCSTCPFRNYGENIGDCNKKYDSILEDYNKGKKD